MTGELFADHGRDETCGEHAVRNAPFENRVAGVIIVHVHRIVVCGHLSKHLDVFIGDDFAQRPHHPHFNLFNGDCAAGHIIQHDYLSNQRLGNKHNAKQDLRVT